MSPAPGMVTDWIGWTPAVIATLTAAAIWVVQRVRGNRADTTRHNTQPAGQTCDITSCHQPVTSVYAAARPDRVLYVCADHSARIQQQAQRWVA